MTRKKAAKEVKLPLSEKRTAFGEDLIQAMQQAADFMAGKDVPGMVVHHADAEIADVKAARKAIGVSQTKFAELVGTPLATVRSWEQGKRHPSGAARTLLKVIEREPAAVKRALRAG